MKSFSRQTALSMCRLGSQDKSGSGCFCCATQTDEQTPSARRAEEIRKSTSAIQRCGGRSGKQRSPEGALSIHCVFKGNGHMQLREFGGVPGQR
eukprot:6199704-Pleurochrysis_carterae.AAC.2